jgi:hypothetical protein
MMVVRWAPARVKAGVATCIALVALGLVSVVLTTATAAAAGASYYLSISEGSSTSPEYPVSGVSAGASGGLVQITIRRSGTVVAQSPPNEFGFTSMSQVPQAGDVVNVESPPGAVVAGVTYDGLPSLDATVCAGSANFSGQRRPNATVSGGYYSLGTVANPYGGAHLGVVSFGEAQVSTLSGSVFAGSFLKPLASGETVFAEQRETSAPAGGGTFFYFSENSRPVGSCPLPPPAAPPAIVAKVVPPGPIALAGQVMQPTLTSIRRLLKSGWLLHVFINQPGTVIQNLYLQGGKLPAFAAKHKQAALLVARGSTTAARAGTVNVLLRATTRGRRALKHARRAKLVLITTLHSASGARISLARYAFSLKH